MQYLEVGNLLTRCTGPKLNRRARIKILTGPKHEVLDYRDVYTRQFLGVGQVINRKFIIPRPTRQIITVVVSVDPDLVDSEELLHTERQVVLPLQLYNIHYDLVGINRELRRGK